MMNSGWKMPPDQNISFSCGVSAFYFGVVVRDNPLPLCILITASSTLQVPISSLLSAEKVLAGRGWDSEHITPLPPTSRNTSQMITGPLLGNYLPSPRAIETTAGLVRHQNHFP